VLDHLHTKKRFARQRESSWDHTGANRDSEHIPAGAIHTLPDLNGPGIIRHIWMTLASQDPDFYRNMHLVFTFDDASIPQIDLPMADFFLFGHGDLSDVNSLPIQVSRQPHLTDPPYRGGLNCLFPMPFERCASLSFKNTGTETCVLYYYVDWEQHPTLEAPVLHFHATLNEEQTQPPEGQPVVEHGRLSMDLRNPDWEENYILLNIDRYEGHYVGTGLSIDCKPDSKGKWWEGDDMFVIDGEPWPPRLHGTGTEDYFNLAWGFRKVESRPEYGITALKKGPEDRDQIDGRFSLYRFHINDPIPFESSLLASIEHGHANDCETHYRSVAYWYGRPIS
jgi:hypothetical protein